MACSTMLRTGVTPMPPVTKTAGMAALLMERERSIRSIQREFRAERHCFQYSLERRVTHPCRGHQKVLVRSTRQREAARVAFRVSFRGIDQSVIGELTRLVDEPLRFFEMERHCSNGDLISGL